MWFLKSLTPFTPIFGNARVGTVRGSFIAIREAPVVVSMAQMTPRVESEASNVVGLSVVRPFRNTASSTTATRLISAGLEGSGK